MEQGLNKSETQSSYGGNRIVSTKALCAMPKYCSPDGEAMFTAPTLCRWRSEGKGPPFIVTDTGQVFYDTARVDKWIEERTFNSTSELPNKDSKRYQHLPAARAKAAEMRKNAAK